MYCSVIIPPILNVLFAIPKSIAIVVDSPVIKPDKGIGIGATLLVVDIATVSAFNIIRFVIEPSALSPREAKFKKTAWS